MYADLDHGPERVALLVLAGGTSRRWAAAGAVGATPDKTAVEVAGRPVLAHVVAGARAHLPPGTPTVIVAPADHPARAAIDAAWPGTRWAREDPPGGGPAAGLAAGLAALTTHDEKDGAVDDDAVDDAAVDDNAVLVVLAGDLPLAGTAVPRLLAAARSVEGAEPVAAVGIDPTGRRQPLLAAYPVGPLRAALAGPVEGAALRVVLACVATTTVPVTAAEALDLDTPAALDTWLALNPWLARNP